MPKWLAIFLLPVFVGVLFGVSSCTNAEITEEKAKEIALERTGGGVVTECRQDFEDGRKVYEIDIVKDGIKYEMDVSATDSQIYGFSQEVVDVGNKDIPANQTVNGDNAKIETNSNQEPVSNKADGFIQAEGNVITKDAATEIAVDRVGGGTVVKCELDRDDGRQIYEIEIWYDSFLHEFEIDALNGEIIKYEIDD